MKKVITALCLLVGWTTVCAQEVGENADLGAAQTIATTAAAGTETNGAGSATAAAGSTTDAAASATDAAAVRVRYGYCSRSQLVQQMPEYTKAVQELAKLREQLENEVYHNETEFRRQYMEYLSGQKDFPQPILLKRQRDLQAAMESGIAFREEGDSLLRKAEEDLMAPLRERVDAAICAVGAERELDYVVDVDRDAFVFLRPELSIDITPYVEEKLLK